MIVRYAFLRSALCVLRSAFILLLAGCVTLAPPAPTRFKILQLNDVYKIEGLEGGQSGGLARVRTLRRYLESDGSTVFVLHAGDALYPSVMSKYLDAKPMVDILNMLDGDPNAHDPRLIVTFGNHELDKSDDKVLMARLAESQFQWIATNTLHCDAGKKCVPFREASENVSELLTYETDDGTKIGFVGLLYPMEKSYAKSVDVIGSAGDAVSALRDDPSADVDVVVAITHQDMDDDAALVDALPGINIVVGGHDHLAMQRRVHNTWIMKADADAKSVIVWDVVVPPGGGPVSTTPLRVVLDSTILKDKDVDVAVQRWMDELSKTLGGNETYGTTKNLLEGVEPAVRGRETALGNLLADVARGQMQTDVAVVNGGGIRINDNIPPGPITRYDMEGIFYYSNKLVAFSATGQQLLDMLRNSVSRVDAGDGRFLQVSGLSFKYRRGSDGAYVVNAEDVQVGGKPLDVGAQYTVATVDYLYLHGTDDGYELFSDANRPPKVNAGREADFRTMVEQYIRSAGTIDVDIDGRIVKEP